MKTRAEQEWNFASSPKMVRGLARREGKSVSGGNAG